jgi:NADPH:quinone reductase-like Zn-dependent oxidoreductase
VDYSNGPVSEQLSSPVDAVLDLVGGPALEDAPKQVRDSARIASIVDAQTVLAQGGRYVFVRPDRDGLDALARLADEGRLRVEVARVMPLDEIADAHRLSEEGHVRGKVVVTIP